MELPNAFASSFKIEVAIVRAYGVILAAIDSSAKRKAA